MASLYRKKRSPFWFIQFIDADGKRRNKSTGLRADDPGQTVKARALRAQLEAKELPAPRALSAAAGTPGCRNTLSGTVKAPAPMSVTSMPGSGWRSGSRSSGYHSPRDITYRNAIEYVDWRTSYKKRTGKTVGRNTAILELKTLAMIMGEAVRLGHADANPLVSIKLRAGQGGKEAGADGR